MTRDDLAALIRGRADDIARVLMPPTEMPKGAGVFLRRLSHLDPKKAAQWLDFVAIPVTYGLKATNRTGLADWTAQFGKQWIAWTWFTTDPGAISEARQFAEACGACAFVINGEKELRGQPELAEGIIAAAKGSLPLGLVSYSVPTTVKDFPWSVFADACDFGMPEIYDREGVFDPRYPQRAVDSWQAHGFSDLIPACGVYQRQDDGTGWRWRTASEISRHLALFPADQRKTLCAWTLGSRIPDSALIALSGAVLR